MYTKKIIKCHYFSLLLYNIVSIGKQCSVIVQEVIYPLKLSLYTHSSKHIKHYYKKCEGDRKLGNIELNVLWQCYSTL